LHRDSSVLQRLLNELDSAGREPAQLASCPYLRAVIQETLRIHPIVTETVRKLAIPMRLGEYELPTGMAVSAATVLAHYNPDVFPEPDRFRPERFLDKNFSPFQYMPFGGGHRRCIGAAFASYEMAMVLGTLLKLCSFELTDPRVVVPKRRSVTMGPSNDVPMVIRRR
jgi:cytochrome P450